MDKEIKESYQIVAEAKATLMLLEDKKQELEASRADFEAERERADGLLLENTELKIQLEAEKNRKLSFWERVTGRKAE